MIRLSAVSIKLGDFLLDNINLTIHSGEFFTILGPTGSGKTVILELIAGLYRPDAGKVLIDEVDAANILREKGNRLCISGLCAISSFKCF